ncbi:MAG: GTP cyclohydrolase IV [Candidatus Altiarchaeales archaeon]|nr:GTP cyclohydrolase IV [Candidatus Altiarchaeales archaeon]
METQDQRPAKLHKLDKVGVSNLKTLVETRYKGRMYRFIPSIDLTIDLSGERKGIHMSRLVEAIAESIEETITAKTQEENASLEHLGKKVLAGLSQRHPFLKGQISFKADLVVKKKTPATRKNTFENHEIMVQVLYFRGGFRKKLSCEVYGNTVCPHSMQHTGKPHIQRAKATLTIETDYEREIDLEDMVDCVEESFSSPVYTLLKTEDEAWVVNRMHENPLFVEDVCRNIISGAQRFSDSRIKVKVVSEESIHRHDVVAEAESST